LTQLETKIELGFQKHKINCLETAMDYRFRIFENNMRSQIEEMEDKHKKTFAQFATEQQNTSSKFYSRFLTAVTDLYT